MDRLPPELIPSIATHLDSKDLQSFALTCREYNEVARQLFEWKIHGLEQGLLFLDLLLRDDDDGATIPLRAVAIRNLAFDPKDDLNAPGAMVIKDISKEVTLVLRTFAIILENCTNVTHLRISASRNAGRFMLSAHEQLYIMEAIHPLSNLRNLHLDYDFYFVSILQSAAKRLERLRGLACSLRFPSPFPFGSLEIPDLKLNLTELYLGLGDCSADRFVQHAAVLFVPTLKTLRLWLAPHKELGHPVLAQVLGALPVTTRIVVCIESFDPAVSSTPITIPGPRSILFAIFESQFSSIELKAPIGMTFIGRWEEIKLDGADVFFASTGAADDIVRVRKGEDMGETEEKEVCLWSQMYQKKLVWF